MPKNKTNNFLKAIKKYAKEQNNAMQSEISKLKTERLKEAERTAKLESDALIKTKLREKQSEQTALLSSKTREGQKRLFIERASMTDEIFELTAKKLEDYAKTGEYRQKLIKSAEEMSKLFEGRDCVLYLCERDTDMIDKLKPLFKGSVEVLTDKTIRIGGLRGYCENAGIIADDTLDRKLSGEREWFTENASLSVL